MPETCDTKSTAWSDGHTPITFWPTQGLHADGRINGLEDLDSLAGFGPISTLQHENLLSVLRIFLQNPS
jgi:hypothetical protein